MANQPMKEPMRIAGAQRENSLVALAALVAPTRASFTHLLRATAHRLRNTVCWLRHTHARARTRALAHSHSVESNEWDLNFHSTPRVGLRNFLQKCSYIVK